MAQIWRLHGLLWNRSSASDGPGSANTGIAFSQSICLHLKSAVEEFKQRHKIEQVFNRFVTILSPLFQRAWHSVLPCNFNASCLICKAGELFSWGKMWNVDCMHLAAFPDFGQGRATGLQDSAFLWVEHEDAGGCGCWRQLSHHSESFRKDWMEKAPFSYKITCGIGSNPFFCRAGKGIIVCLLFLLMRISVSQDFLCKPIWKL